MATYILQNDSGFYWNAPGKSWGSWGKATPLGSHMANHLAAQFGGNVKVVPATPVRPQMPWGAEN